VARRLLGPHDTLPCVLIGDDNSRGNEDSIQIDRKTNDWIKTGCYVLSRAERDLLCNNEWLKGMHMNAVQVSINNQFPHIGSLQNTAILQLKKVLSHFKESWQIIYIDNNHWIVASTINCKLFNITIYDSMNSSDNMETQSIL